MSMIVKFGHSYDNVFNDAEVFLIGLKGIKYEETGSIVGRISDMIIGFGIAPSDRSTLYQAIDVGLSLLHPFVDMSLFGDVVKIESKSKNFCYTGSLVDILSMMITVEDYIMREIIQFRRRSFTGVNIRLNIEDLCILYDVDMSEVVKRVTIEKANLKGMRLG